MKMMESVGLDFGKLLMVEKLGFKDLFCFFKLEFSDFKVLALGVTSDGYPVGDHGRSWCCY